MSEDILREYFDGKVKAETLALGLRGSQTKTGSDAISVSIRKATANGTYHITREHLLNLCDDVIAGKVTSTNLNTIAFALICSDYFTWDREENTPDGSIVSDTIYDWDNPEIGYPLSNENLLKWRTYLISGQYSFTRSDLKTRKPRGRGKDGR